MKLFSMLIVFLCEEGVSCSSFEKERALRPLLSVLFWSALVMGYVAASLIRCSLLLKLRCDLYIP